MAPSVKRPGTLAFAVEPQSPAHTLNEPARSQEGKQITFKTDQHQYRHSLQKTDSEQVLPSTIQAPSSYSQRIRFADPKTQNGFTPRQFKTGERPAKRARVVKYGRYHSEPSLSIRRPVKVYVPMDAWQLIFQRCDLAFLMKARLVCRAFRDALNRQATWREARLNNYGDGIPDRPPHTTEFEYAALLVGRGCQIEPCTRKDTRKVYWPFSLRMCERCFPQVTEVPDLDCAEAKSYSSMYNSLEYEVRETIPAELPGLLPAGRLRSGRWYGPRLLDNEQRNWQQRYMTGHTLVMTNEYEMLKQEFAEKVRDDPEYFLFWARLKWGETREKMTWAIQMDDIDLAESDRLCDLREQKIEFFQEMALTLDPPMSQEVLSKFTAYHNALETPNAASLRSWDTLKAKIDVPELRAQAEQLVQWQRDAIEWTITLDDDSNLYRRLYKHRGSGRYSKPKVYAKEQEVVIEIARAELDGLVDVVHDEDVLLMLLDKVRRAYESLEEKPIGLNGDGSEGIYRLTLDDASMVVQDVLRPRIADVSQERFKKIVGSLRCMGCTRTGASTLYEFQDLIAHARRVHAGSVAKDTHWYRLAVPAKSSWGGYGGLVAWYHLPWFKNMPALPFHQTPRNGVGWDPDIERAYVQHEGTRSPSKTFDRLVCDHSTRIPADDFTSNFCRAVRTLVHTRLQARHIIKTALEYAMRRRKSCCSAGVPPVTLSVGQLQNLEAICARISSKMEFKFQCKICVKEAATSRRRRRVPKTYMLSALAIHWDVSHPTDADTCVTERIVLPSEVEVLRTIRDEDARLALQKASHLKRNGRGNDSMDPRTAALLETPSIQSCLENLFTPLSVMDTLSQSEDAHVSY